MGVKLIKTTKQSKFFNKNTLYKVNLLFNKYYKKWIARTNYKQILLKNGLIKRLFKKFKNFLKNLQKIVDKCFLMCYSIGVKVERKS